MVIFWVIITVIVMLLVIVIVIDVYHPDQPAGPDRVAGTDVLTDDNFQCSKEGAVDVDLLAVKK